MKIPMKIRDMLKDFVEFDDAPDAPVPPPSAAPQPDGFDPADLYQNAGIPPLALTAEQALEILGSLQKELAPETQRLVFKELLQAKGAPLGVPPEAVKEDARRKIDILSAEAREIPEKLADFVSSTESEIEKLEEQIRDLQKSMEEVKAEQQQILKECHGEIERLTTVLQLLQAPGGRAA